MSISFIQLCTNLYKIIAQTIANIPIEIKRKKEKKKSKLSNLVKHPGTILGNPESLVHIDWVF